MDNYNSLFFFFITTYREIKVVLSFELATSLLKTLLTFPSNKGVGKSKAEEIMLPAVVRPIPGKDIQVSKSVGQDSGSKDSSSPISFSSATKDFFIKHVGVYKENEKLHKLSGIVYDKPSRTTIEISENKHIDDDYGII